MKNTIDLDCGFDAKWLPDSSARFQPRALIQLSFVTDETGPRTAVIGRLPHE